MRSFVKNPAVSWLFPEVRLRVLAKMLVENETLHARELARQIGMNHSAVRREIFGLARAGILLRERSGNRVYYRANPDCPIHNELKMLILKTVGLADVLKEALEPLRKKIKLAYIYGGFAKGGVSPDSDVDVMIVGKVTLREVVSALMDASKVLSREINPTVFSGKEYNESLAEGEGFVYDVHNGPKILLIGE